MACCAFSGMAATHADDKKIKALGRPIAVYLPRTLIDERVYIPRLNTAFTPGRALMDAALDMAKIYFGDAAEFDAGADRPFNMLLVAHSKFDVKERIATITVTYKILDAAGEAVTEGEHSDEMDMAKLLETNGFYAMSLKVMREILSDDRLHARLGDPTQDAATTSAAAFDPKLIVSREKPAKSGTGFYINEQGQVLTAAHVAHGCPVVDITADGKSADGKVVAESLLLDLAIVESGTGTTHVVPLRDGSGYELGESVTNIGYPLQGVLTASPNVTRGNISSRTAMAGSLGQFQFSAPVQPGSSGGPVVSDGGELLGITVGTLSIQGLIQRGILPQNVNFALDAKYAASFMDHNHVHYVSVPARQAPAGKSATESTLPAVVQLQCYE